MFLQLTRLIAVLATTVNMGNAYDNQDNKVGDVLKQLDMNSSTTRSLDNIFQDVQEGSISSNQDAAPPVLIQEANDDVSVADQHNTVLVAESGGDFAMASTSILLDSSPTPKPTTIKKGKSVKTATTSKPTNSKSSKSKLLTTSPTHQPTSQPDKAESMDMNNHGAAPAPIQDVNDVSVDDQHDTVVAASGDVVALASIPVLLGDSAPTPQPTTIKRGKSVKTGTTSKPTNSKSSKSKLLTMSPTHHPTSHPDEGIMDMTNHDDTAPAAPTNQEMNTANDVEEEEVVAVTESGSGVASYYSESILIASVVVPSNSKSSKATMSMNQYDEFIGV